jgi:hypothetical protein
MAAYRIDLGEGRSLTPGLGAAADYRFFAGDVSQDLAFEGLTGRVSGTLDFATASGARLGIAYGASGLGARNSAVAQSIKASLSVPF